jgi:NAD-dependent deacetylase
VIGTSLAVYPAAGLLQYAPTQIPKFVLDKNIPALGAAARVTKIEAAATEGIKLLKEQLQQYL